MHAMLSRGLHLASKNVFVAFQHRCSFTSRLELSMMMMMMITIPITITLKDAIPDICATN